MRFGGFVEMQIMFIIRAQNEKNPDLDHNNQFTVLGGNGRCPSHK